MATLMSWNNEYGTFVQGKSINEQDCDLDAEKTPLDLWMFIATVHEKWKTIWSSGEREKYHPSKPLGFETKEVLQVHFVWQAIISHWACWGGGKNKKNWELCPLFIVFNMKLSHALSGFENFDENCIRSYICSIFEFGPGNVAFSFNIHCN